MRIVISGATSMIGAALTNKLSENKHEVVAVVRPNTKKTETLINSSSLSIVECDMKDYSNLTNNTNACGPCESLVCTVQSCTYNKNQACTAEAINVAGDNVVVYTEANCSTFKHV